MRIMDQCLAITFNLINFNLNKAPQKICTKKYLLLVSAIQSSQYILVTCNYLPS